MVPMVTILFHPPRSNSIDPVIRVRRYVVSEVTTGRKEGLNKYRHCRPC